MTQLPIVTTKALPAIAATQSKEIQVLPPTKAAVLSALKPLLDSKGEINIASMDFSDRLTSFAQFIDNADFNAILLEQNILSQLPVGASMIPLVVFPKASDAWEMSKILGSSHPDNANKVMPSADFYIKIASLLNIKLQQDQACVVTDTGQPMYSIRYTAYLTLPDGSILSVNDEGKDQELYNKNGIQAHIVENTRKKAKRNAIKALLAMPTVMDRDQFMMPFVLFRPVFRPESEEARAIIADLKAFSDAATSRLYSRPSITLTEDSGASFEDLREAMEQAADMDALAVVSKRVRAATINGDQRAQLAALYKLKTQALVTPSAALAAPQAEGGGY